MTLINTKQAVVYCRVSSWGQAKTNSYSLQLQVRDCLAYCDEIGIEVKAVFTDIGSAYKPHLLHGRRQALRMCRANRCPICVHWDDRLSRMYGDGVPDYGKLVVNGFDTVAIRAKTERGVCA